VARTRSCEHCGALVDAKSSINLEPMPTREPEQPEPVPEELPPPSEPEPIAPPEEPEPFIAPPDEPDPTEEPDPIRFPSDPSPDEPPPEIIPPGPTQTCGSPRTQTTNASAMDTTMGVIISTSSW
jgi:hypothetical protein